MPNAIKGIMTVSVLFFAMGTYFLSEAFKNWATYGLYGTAKEGAQPYEELLLGAILFIPGSYHTFLAIMAFFEQDGFDYKDVATFENDEWWDDSD